MFFDLNKLFTVNEIKFILCFKDMRSYTNFEENFKTTV
jgi:hypothetical protein